MLRCVGLVNNSAILSLKCPFTVHQNEAIKYGGKSFIVLLPGRNLLQGCFERAGAWSVGRQHGVAPLQGAEVHQGKLNKMGPQSIRYEGATKQSINYSCFHAQRLKRVKQT